MTCVTWQHGTDGNLLRCRTNHQMTSDWCIVTESPIYPLNCHVTIIKVHLMAGIGQWRTFVALWCRRLNIESRVAQQQESHELTSCFCQTKDSQFRILRHAHGHRFDSYMTLSPNWNAQCGTGLLGHCGHWNYMLGCHPQKDAHSVHSLNFSILWQFSTNEFGNKQFGAPISHL